MFQPELLLYVAGRGSLLRGPAGRPVAEFRRLAGARPAGDLDRAAQRIPVAIVLAGGYAMSVEDTVTIHANTARVAREVLDKTGWKTAP